MENIKKHWKMILIVLLIIFGMNKCTTSCNRSSTINKQTIVIDSLKNRADSLVRVIDLQNAEISQMNLRINDNKAISLGNNAYLQDSIIILNGRLQNMSKMYKNEVKEHNKTKKELKKLQENK